MSSMDIVKKRIIISMGAIVLLILTLVGITYAYFIAKVQGNTNNKSVTVSAGMLRITYGDGNSNITAEKIMPGTVIKEKTFTVKNTGTRTVENYDVYLDNVINELENYKDLTYVLTCKLDDGTACNGSSGVFPKSRQVIATNTIDVDVIHNYKLIVTYNETNKDQSIDMNKTIDAKVNIKDDNYSIKTLNIYGNSIQNQTPSLESPVEIVSLGNKTENIYKKYPVGTVGSTLDEEFDDGFKVTTKINTGGYSSYVRTPILNLDDLEWGKTYTISFYVEMSNLNMNPFLRIGYINKSNGEFWGFKQQAAINNSINTITFTLPNEKPEYFGSGGGYGSDHVLLFINIQRNALEEYGSLTIKNIMLTEGDVYKEYEPYNYYKIPITLTDNLFDINNIEQYQSRNGYGDHPLIKVGELLTVKGRYAHNNSNLIPLPEEKTVYVSGEVIGTDKFNMNVVKTKNDRTSFENISNTYKSNIEGKFIYSFTIPEDNENIYGLNIYSTSAYSETNGIKDFRISYNHPDEAVNETTTDIYLDEPLRKIGDCDTCSDYIDLENGKVVRYVKSRVFDGTENWLVYDKQENHFDIKVYDNYYSLNENYILSNYYKQNKLNDNYYSNNDYSVMSAEDIIRFKNKDYTNLSDWTNYVNNLEPKLYVNYKLDKPEVTPISIPLLNLDEDKVLRVCDNNGTCASNIEIEYDN